MGWGKRSAVMMLEQKGTTKKYKCRREASLITGPTICWPGDLGTSTTLASQPQLHHRHHQLEPPTAHTHVICIPSSCAMLVILASHLHRVHPSTALVWKKQLGAGRRPILVHRCPGDEQACPWVPRAWVVFCPRRLGFEEPAGLLPPGAPIAGLWA